MFACLQFFTSTVNSLIFISELLTVALIPTTSSTNFWNFSVNYSFDSMLLKSYDGPTTDMQQRSSEKRLPAKKETSSNTQYNGTVSCYKSMNSIVKMTYKISMGSKAKGYAIPSSDDDVVCFVKSEKSEYLQYFTQLKKPQNKIYNKNDENQYTQSDLLTGLMGVYTGKYPYLFMFGNDSNIPDERLLTFIRVVGNARLKFMLDNLVNLFDISAHNRNRCVFKIRPKFLLQKLFHLSYVDYCLRHGKCPPRNYDISLPNLLNDEQFVALYHTLMERRLKSGDGEDCTFSNEEIHKIDKFQERLKKAVVEMVDPDEDYHFLQQILEYFLYDKPLIVIK